MGLDLSTKAGLDGHHSSGPPPRRSLERGTRPSIRVSRHTTQRTGRLAFMTASSSNLLHILDEITGYAEEWPCAKISSWTDDDGQHWVAMGDPELAVTKHWVASETDLEDTKALAEIHRFVTLQNDGGGREKCAQ